MYLWVSYDSKSKQRLFYQPADRCYGNELCRDTGFPNKLPQSLIHMMQCRQINYEVKTVVFCNVAPCSLKKAGRRFRGRYYLHHHPERQLSSYSSP
jgi:hypothetical protein